MQHEIVPRVLATLGPTTPQGHILSSLFIRRISLGVLGQVLCIGIVWDIHFDLLTVVPTHTNVILNRWNTRWWWWCCCACNANNNLRRISVVEKRHLFPSWVRYASREGRCFYVDGSFRENDRVSVVLYVTYGRLLPGKRHNQSSVMMPGECRDTFYSWLRPFFFALSCACVTKSLDDSARGAHFFVGGLYWALGPSSIIGLCRFFLS